MARHKTHHNRGRPPANKRPVEFILIGARCGVLLVEVFREMCKRKKLSQREAMEDALQKWCGVKVPMEPRLEDII